MSFVLIHVMSQEGYDVFTVDHPTVAVDLKLARPIAHPLTQTLSVWYMSTTKYMFISS